MRVLYLFSGVRGALIKKVERGEDPGGGLWGMLGLRKFDIASDIAELEQWFSPKAANFLRFKIFGVYGAHLPFLLRFFRYDIVYTAGAFTSQFIFTVLKTVLRFERPIWVMQDFSIMGLLGKEHTLRQRLFAWMVSRAGGVVTTGQWETKALARRFPHLAEKIEFIPFGTDTTFFSPRSTQEERVILSVGVDPDRDWSTFFKACEGQNAKVVLIGSARRLKSFAPPAFVEVVSGITTEAMRDAYGRATVVVIPLDTRSGVNDAMGCSTLYEAMSMGKPVVVSRTHVMESYIADGENGLLVDQQNVEAMRAAIKECLDDSQKRRHMGEAARTYALEYLDLDKNAEKLARYFKKIASS